MATNKQANAGSFWIDDQGNVQRRNTRGTYGFKEFYKGRPELTGTLAMNHDWLTLNRPDILKGEPHDPKRKQRQRGEPVEQEVREPDPYAMTFGRFKNRQPVGQPPGRSGYDLTNVRTRGNAYGEIGGDGDSGSGGFVQPAIGPPGGAQPRGTQFDRPGLPPAPGVLHYPGAIDTTEGGQSSSSSWGVSPGGFNPRKPGMSEAGIGRIRSDLSDV
jgi:hypothetical protein